MQRFWQRYRIGLAVALRLISLVVGLAGIALYVVEPSVKAIWISLALWCFGVPIAALGYVRKMDRMAAQVPVTPAAKNPTTTVDISSVERR